MARAALGWSLDELAARSAVNRWTILRFEGGASDARPTNRNKLRNALEAAGVRFIMSGDFAGGVAPPLIGDVPKA